MDQKILKTSTPGLSTALLWKKNAWDKHSSLFATASAVKKKGLWDCHRVVVSTVVVNATDVAIIVASVGVDVKIFDFDFFSEKKF